MIDKPVALITGSTRGIGKAIAMKLASVGYHLIITGKTKEPHPKLAGTIDSVVSEIRELGYSADAYQLDVRHEEEVQSLFHHIEKTYGRLDVLINNASAINLTSTEETPIKKFDLMQQVNGRATFMCSQYAVKLLEKAPNPHILVMSPPIDLNPKWFKPHLAYTMSKYAMSFCVLGLSEELRDKKIAVNALWPKTIIATAAIEFNFPKELLAASRYPTIVADAAFHIIQEPSTKMTGQFFIDEEVLASYGIKDFSGYAVNPAISPMKDLYL
jgi:citronellol/citronellal dehydrogenase